MSQWSKCDIEMMSLAISLAEKGRYTTRPNPNVGCVIVANGEIIGQGYHIKAGGPHAEIHALKDVENRQLQQLLPQATAYVTLEPCSHYGKTPPCAKALIAAKVKRVVIAQMDANPQVAGNGVSMLEAAGIKVDVGLLTAAASQLNIGFMKRMTTGLPEITIKLAASLDGKTALSNGVSKWITGPEARADVQKLRARHCALVTGVETVLADDPSLNVRYEQLAGVQNSLAESDLQQPLRVVLDSKARLTADYKMFTIETPILLVSCVDYPAEVKQDFKSHVSFITIAANNDGRVDLHALFTHLGQHCNSVLVEAGASVAGSVIQSKLADTLYLYQAMKILGSHGRNLMQLDDYQTMDQIPDVQLTDCRRIGTDQRLILKLNSPAN
ncbi:bifunctional diaminohydroxyphosphoribosylaminopyrimidine deaminase/5-amino-6-(5-phosphoribosylamino)uracil reductase RibD [Pseudomonadota bacterium]|uniref:bifunctional diaminohydroxyphosphoribosylaminopyrimidine deaminase/5-amino-6-(5-phosphoribosylamino)uracil reductase RibD n=1 Tax=unclassified Shewanella TaxID=196818 RepID=UPI000C824E03|nr:MULTISPECIES: bifunctional diaminohydroxyphosphoribosylaminopyrimidine deaminase/5-amino-6-(5-phosphoribosylamino)uracil reductase RibD [unclassified Shewanella]MDO6620435.1 bifunctional diaminohydroxyphosphoribosylaminopyrimidine deaminase/5-amino-6-(5-phosphoribosylamino)uracil reductase RibD [Shewanella sp. 6_MG-2023]PMG26993.1 riboflavin biosynthesis protein RibD [Shewanella sp. 10N.286.52.C2]